MAIVFGGMKDDPAGCSKAGLSSKLIYNENFRLIKNTEHLIQQHVYCCTKKTRRAILRSLRRVVNEKIFSLQLEGRYTANSTDVNSSVYCMRSALQGDP